MRIVVFDLIGKIAHFRKYYTNSSSLTYAFPPRTTITGLIAGILGFERDSYYEKFSIQNAKISVSLKSPIRKLIETVNYVWAEKPSDLNLSAGKHTQIPVEIIVPQEWDDNLRYRIFFTHKDVKLLEEFVVRVKNKNFIYPPYLGISEFIADTEFVDFDDFNESFSSDPILLTSILNTDVLKSGVGQISFRSEGALYVKEKMPIEFDNNRKLSSPPKEFIIEVKGKGINVTLNKPYFEIGEDKLIFMEE